MAQCTAIHASITSTSHSAPAHYRYRISSADALPMEVLPQSLAPGPSFRFSHTQTHLTSPRRPNFNLTMTISKATSSELFEVGPDNKPQLIRMKQRFSGRESSSSRRKVSPIGWWTIEEHDKFLEAMELYPSGPWKKIARHVGTRTPRQAMTHAQKYRQRIKRRTNLKRRSKTEKATSTTQTESSFDNKSTSDTSKDVSELVTPSSSPEIDAMELVLRDLQEQCESEFCTADFMLLDEVLEHSHPNGNGIPAYPLSFLNDEELVQILLDPSLDCVGLDCVGAGLHFQ